MTTKENKVILGGERAVLYLDVVIVTRLYSYVETERKVLQKK